MFTALYNQLDANCISTANFSGFSLIRGMTNHHLDSLRFFWGSGIEPPFNRFRTGSESVICRFNLLYQNQPKRCWFFGGVTRDRLIFSIFVINIKFNLSIVLIFIIIKIMVMVDYYYYKYLL